MLPAILALFTALASSLSESNPIAFLKAFDPAMEGYGSLETDVTALAGQSDILSSVEILKDEGDQTRRTVEVDWFLQLTLQATGTVERRRQTVTCRVERRRNRWKIVAMDHLELFRPQKTR